ncbi:MAG: hypothetical protein A2821_03950 [Candidatus Magasanikbacteria bacterium RIFCSPHIGHO2_01_FULL_41_23]|nr:MAG: hypothetical protein A2821_03950 [Candidatus Magasanikbacteria bacterium RIFCSPHIGHO2_01_FULL_41_23]OGH66969.1 MAG: hypothetical protein A3C66_00490 [Candidatus Magasanikbacteria bacterium RIFCSPHIGHO2_02_FULL_41_35]OGH74950.1 MAG: hypothetical protein A3F22_02625 [Candidatus Magasanikbacteria bacterium RIFCSPHIGHO2_12_FULL_41_16]
MILFIYTILFLLYVPVLIFMLYTLYAIVKGAPYVPLARENVMIMIQTAKLKSTDIFFDLGSGDGRLLRAAAPLVKQCVGIEINPLLYYWSRFLCRNYKNITIKRQDLWTTDLREINVISLFFIAHKMDKLAIKLSRELKTGARVVSYGFKFSSWKPTEKNGKVYLYIFPDCVL